MKVCIPHSDVQKVSEKVIYGRLWEDIEMLRKRYKYKCVEIIEARVMQDHIYM